MTEPDGTNISAEPGPDVQGLLDAIESHAILVVGRTGDLVRANATARRVGPGAAGEASKWLEAAHFHGLETGEPPRTTTGSLLDLAGSQSTVPTVLGWLDASGKRHVFNLSFAPVGSQGATVCTFGDVTAEWVLRDALTAGDTGQEADPHARNIAHDLSNAFGIAQIAADTLTKLHLSDEANRHVGSILAACARGSALTQGLLDGPNAAPLAPVAIDVSLALTDLARLATRVMPRDIAFDLSTPEQPIHVACRKADFDTSVMHLLSNARKAIATRGGETGGNVRVKLSREDDDVRLEVSHDGVGLSPAVLQQVRDPYFSLPGAMAGHGVGLAFVETFVWRVGGQLDVLDRPGGGTRVVMHLPASVPPQTIHPQGIGADPALSLDGYRILLAEADEGFRLVLTEALRGVGAMVAEAASGQEALRALDHAPPHVLITNLRLSDGMPGADLARDVEANNPQTALVFLTGFAERAPEGTFVIRKPVRLPELISVIQRLAVRSD